MKTDRKNEVSFSNFKSRTRKFLWSLGLEVLTKSRSRSWRLRSRLSHCYLVLPMQKKTQLKLICHIFHVAY